jgi:DNA-binding transcriptional MerR regulator
MDFKIRKKYSIGEVSKLLNVSKSTLVHWADRQYIPKPHFTNDLRRARYWLEDELEAIYEYRQRYYQY